MTISTKVVRRVYDPTFYAPLGQTKVCGDRGHLRMRTAALFHLPRNKTGAVIELWNDSSLETDRDRKIAADATATYKAIFGKDAKVQRRDV